MSYDSTIVIHGLDEELYEETAEWSDLLFSPNWLQEIVVWRAESDPDRTALISQDESVSYEELARAIASIQLELEKHGVKKGDRVVSFVGNSPAFVALLIASLRSGTILVPLSAGLTDTEISRFLDVAFPSLVVYDAERDGDISRKYGYAAVQIDEAASKEFQGVFPCSVELDAEDPCLIVFTSGSTGSPKGVLLALKSIIHATSSLSDVLDCTDQDVFLNALPTNHLFSINAGILLPLLKGAATVLVPKFSATKTLDAIEKHQVSVFSGVPTMFKRMEKEQQHQPRNVRSMRTGFIAGAQCDSLNEFQHTLHCKPQVLYGLTESPVISAASNCNEEACTNVGELVKGVSICFRDAEGNVTADGMGELLCKSPGTMLSYFRNEKKTSEAIDSDGWLHTGDLGYVDDKGRLCIIGRKDDVINRGGYKIFPSEIEEACSDYPGIIDCCAIGMPHKELGQQIVVFAELRFDADADAEALRKHASVRLSKQKLPDQLIRVNKMPYLDNEKIDREALRKVYASSQGTFSDDEGRLALDKQ